ncbi:MAG TPA: hypothetical protein VK050_08030 [Flavobacteriaceae bacterium]|nr:hypothetical protein [Flavobacteriaceae bacterium]
MQRLLYILVYPIWWGVSILPMPVLYILSDVFFFLTYYVIGYRRKVVKENLALTLPNKTEQERKQIAKEFYAHLCDILVETIKSLTISKKEINRRFKFENPEILQKLYDQDKSVLLMCGHYASWEWSGIVTQHMPYDGLGVYKELRNPYFDKMVKSIREKFGGEIVSNKQIVTKLFRMHRDNQKSLTLILSDQTPKLTDYKHVDTFMGIRVPVFVGTEELAKRLGHIPVYLHVEKIKRGHYSARFIPLTMEPESIPDYGITRMFLDEIEKQIHKAPAYYLWSHKRWKHRNDV